MHKNAWLYTFGKETKHKEKEVAPTTDLFNRADFFFLEYAALIGIARLQVLRLCFLSVVFQGRVVYQLHLVPRF
jgi:hypothetical protein